MRITSIRIENFRSIKSLHVDLGETTVFIGPNNAGKTAILDAVRIALTRRWGQRGTGFTEYDIHLARENDDPKTSPGVAIEVRVEESAQGEWPDEVHQALEDIAEDDPVTGRSSELRGQVLQSNSSLDRGALSPGFYDRSLVAGLMSVVGVPLPMVSYGGSVLASMMFAIGVIMNVSMRRFIF